MKKFLQVGTQLDINAAYDGGAVDSSVQYSVPASMQDVITVSSAGVVSAVSEGTAVLEIKDTSGHVLRSIIFDVVSPAEFVLMQDLLLGSLVIQTAPAAPPVTLLSATNLGTVIASSNYWHPWGFSNEGIADRAFDGNVDALTWSSAETFGNTINAWIGRMFFEKTQVKKVRVIGWTLPKQVVFQYTNDFNGTPTWTDITTYTFNAEDVYDSQTQQIKWVEITLPDYPAAFALRMKSNSTLSATNVTVDRFRVSEMQLDRVKPAEMDKLISYNNMSANTQNGYTAFGFVGSPTNFNEIYAGSLANFAAHRLFNQDRMNEMLYVSHDYTGYFGQIMPEQKVLKSYSVMSTIKDGVGGNDSIRKWILQGSNDTTNGTDGTWVDLDSRDITGDRLKTLNLGYPYPAYYASLDTSSIQISSAMEKRIFEVNNNTAYKSYRLKVLSLGPVLINGSWWSTNQVISEIEFYS